MCLGCTHTFGRRRAGELLVKPSPERRCEFYSLWNDMHAHENSKIFYDVTSFSTYSGLIQKAQFGYNRDGEALRQVNQGLFCVKNHKIDPLAINSPILQFQPNL